MCHNAYNIISDQKLMIFSVKRQDQPWKIHVYPVISQTKGQNESSTRLKPRGGVQNSIPHSGEEFYWWCNNPSGAPEFLSGMNSICLGNLGVDLAAASIPGDYCTNYSMIGLT